MCNIIFRTLLRIMFYRWSYSWWCYWKNFANHPFWAWPNRTKTHKIYIYIRNLHFQGQWRNAPSILRYFLLLFPLLVVWYGYNNGAYDRELLLNNSAIPNWLFWLGVSAQLIFTFRFIYQWYYSERRKTSHLPKGFWRLSALGATMIIAYALWRQDPVLLVGHGSGLIIYVRNLFIGKNESRE